MGARCHGFRWMALMALMALATAALPPGLRAQVRLDFPFVQADRTLGPAVQSTPNLELKRGCRLVLTLTGAKRSDVMGWQFSLGDLEMDEFGRPGPDQPAAYNVIVPGAAPNPVSLTLTGAPDAAIASLGTMNLRVTDLGSSERCPAPGVRDTSPDPASIRRSARGYPPVYDRARRMANLRFNHFGLPDTTARGTPEKFPEGITDNDMITVLLDLPDTVAVSGYSVELTGNIKGEAISVVGEGDLSKIPIGTPFGTEGRVGSSLYSLGTFGPYSAPQVTIRIVRSVGGATVVDRSYTLRIRRTYVAALRLGVARSGVRFPEFQAGPRSSSDATRVIRNLNDGRDREVRPYLTLVFYGWRFWERRFWDGRDIEAEPTPSERLNPMVGAGLEDLGDEWLLGFSFELARGLDLNLAYQAARVSVLQSGFQEGEALPGTDPPPTSEEWDSGVTIGASIDLRVAASVLSGLTAGK
jgi:hypothetical protein